MGIRFSFDLGTNSIGWAVFEFGPGHYGATAADNVPKRLIDAGVRIFSDGRNPKDGQSLAVMRRGPRAQRRRRDRFLLRRRDLINALVSAGLWPTDQQPARALAELDPYRLRAEGLDRALGPYEFGRVLFHLNQRRGFKSNRKTDKRKDGKIDLGRKSLEQRLADERCRTVGEFLWRRHNHQNVRERQPVRIRLQGEGAKALYDFYPSRAMLEHEFDTLWRAQAAFAPERLDDGRKEAIRKILFRQRPLRRPKVGFCTFVAGEPRLPRAMPSVEARVIYETLNHLEIETGGGPRRLELNERDALATVLLAGSNLTMTQMRKALKLGSGEKINFEEGGRDKIEGARSAAVFGGKKGPFGALWQGWPLARRDAFVSLLLGEDDDVTLIARLIDDFEFTQAQAEAASAAGMLLDEGYARLGRTANAAVLDQLKAAVIPYSEAARRAGWHHSDERDGEIRLPLPFYPEVLGRHIIPGDGISADYFANKGRIANPTVHICLNQLRRLVNLLVEHYGAPDEIVLELARDLKNGEERKRELEAENRRNREAAEKRSARLAELGQRDTGENRALLRLFEEQARAGGGVAYCPYSLRVIAPHQLFSSDIDIDHVLPLSRTLDDTRGNKVLCYRACNRVKRNMTPYEAFRDGCDLGDGKPASWADIMANATTLHGALRWRFQPEAMEKFNANGRDFLARQLNETRYLSRLAKAYLGKACNPDKVWVVTGQMIGLLRGKWGLNDLLLGHNAEPGGPETEERARKDRSDHRHHAIDAMVIGVMTRGLVNEIARRAGQAEERDERIFAGIEPPFADFRQAARMILDRMSVSHKPDHGTQGALHEDTAYGIVADATEAAAIGNLVRRKPIDSLTAPEIDAVRDRILREDLQALRAPFLDGRDRLPKDQAKAFQQALRAFGLQRGVRRIRVGKADKSARTIADRSTGAAYKAIVPGDNHHMDVVQLRDGSWQGFAASVFEVNRRDWRPRWEVEKTGGKLVMRLHKGDMIELADADGRRRLKTVVRLSPSNNIVYLVPHNEGGDFQKRHDDPDDLFRWDFANIARLKERGAVPMRVDEAGRVSRRPSNVLGR